MVEEDSLENLVFGEFEYSWLGNLFVGGVVGWLWFFSVKVEFLEKNLENDDLYRVWVVGFMLFVKLLVREFENRGLKWRWLGINRWWKLLIELIFCLLYFVFRKEELFWELYWLRLLKWFF